MFYNYLYSRYSSICIFLFALILELLLFKLFQIKLNSASIFFRYLSKNG